MNVKHKLAKAIQKIFLFSIICCFVTQLYSQTLVSSNIITPVCPGGSGTVELSFSGASYPFTLEWKGSNIQNGSVNITGSPQIVTITGTSSGYNNTGTYASFFVNSNWIGQAAVGIHFNPFTSITATCASGANIAVNNISGGAAPYTISLINKSTGTTIGSGSSPLNIPFSQICPISGGVFLKVEDINGCYARIDSIWVNCRGLEVDLTSTNASCTNGTATVISVTGGTGPYTYLWSNGATSSSITGLRKGYYTCTVYDVNGCSGSNVIYVNQNPTISVNKTTKPATCNNADGQATLFPSGGTAPYSFLWSNGATTETVMNLSPNIFHTVIVTDANGCIQEETIEVTSISPVFVNYTSVPSSCSSSTGSAELFVSGGTSPYTYKWFGSASRTNIANGLAVGLYSFIVTDANGCERTGTVQIQPNSQLNLSISKTNAVCPVNSGSMTAIVTGNAPPFVYSWSNGSSTQSITNLPAGGYTCTITDANNCKVTKSDFIAVESPLVVNFSTVNASCIYTANGSITANARGGSAPYTYLWSNGANTATITGLTTGRYYVSITDAAGCKRTNYVFLDYNASNDNCYCTVKGMVYNDLNGNCIKDPLEEGIADVLIEASSFGYTSTDAKGNYSFKLPAGTYTITETLDKNSSLSSCQSNGIVRTITTTGNGCTQTVNFANQLTPYHDIVSLIVHSNFPIPGNNYLQKHVIKNRGNATENNIQIGFKHDGQLLWQNTYGIPYVNRSNHYFQLSSPLTLTKGSSKEFYVDFFTTTTLPMGTQIYFQDSAAYQSPVFTYWRQNEETPWNNLCDHFETVRSSYDPNYKEVFPQGISTAGIVPTATPELMFVTHFENNGTAEAQKVVVIDTLDANLDVSSFKVLNSSHKVRTEIKNGTVIFTFDNINLAYTPVGVLNLLAQGYVAYTIKPKKPVREGTKLNTKADIYFDYNAPITTNETINTFSDQIMSSNPVHIKTSEIDLFPNPANSQLNITIPKSFSGIKTIQIINLLGQIENVYQENKNQTRIDISSLNSGLHFIRVTDSSNQIGFGKFIKQ